MAGMEPEFRAMLERAQERAAAVALPSGVAEAQLAARGEHPVSVAYGDLGSGEAVNLMDQVTAAARRLQVKAEIGYDDATTYFFPSHDAAVQFIAAVIAFAEPCWTVTATAQPVYNLGGYLCWVMPPGPPMTLAGEIRGYTRPDCPECGKETVIYSKQESADYCAVCGWMSAPDS